MLLENLYCIWPNDQFCCLHWTTNEIKQCSWRKANWQIEKMLYSIVTMQGHTHVWSLGKNYWSLVGMFCHIHHIVLTLHHLITFCFDLYKTPWMVLSCQPNKNGKLNISILDWWNLERELENFRNERKYLRQRLIDLISGKRTEQFEKFESK